MMKGGLFGVLLAYIVGKTLSAFWLSGSAFLEATKQWGKKWWKVSTRRLQPQMKELVHFAFHTNISATISLFTKDSEILWVSLFRSNTEAGYYKLALALANVVQLPINPLPQATYPELSRQAALKKWGNMRYIMRQGSILAGIYSLIATILLVIFGRSIISIVYSSEYLPAYPALIILLCGYFITNIFYWRRPVLLSLGHPEFPAKVNAILASVKIVAVILFVPTYGYLASALLLSSFYWVGSFINIIKINALMKQQGEET